MLLLHPAKAAVVVGGVIESGTPEESAEWPETLTFC